MNVYHLSNWFAINHPMISQAVKFDILLSRNVHLLKPLNYRVTSSADGLVLIVELKPQQSTT